MTIAVAVCAVVSLIIGGGVLLGGYLPNRLFNARIQPRTCQVFYGVASRWCRQGSITQTCYDVRRNVKPDGAMCWQSLTIGTFTNQQQAEQYASRGSSFSFPCFWDPNNACSYYDDYADVVGTLWAGVTFTCLSAVLFGVVVGVALWKCKRDYQQV